MAYRDDLEAALRRAEAAERSLAALCFIHPQSPSVTTCAGCDRGICEACTMTALEGGMCPRCFARAQARSRRRQLLGLFGSGTAALALAAGIVFFLGRTAAESSGAAEAARRAQLRDRYSWKTRGLEGVLLREPCNLASALELAVAYNQGGKYENTIAFADNFESECGLAPRLLSAKFFAHEQRGEWLAASQLATRLIENQPGDSDFWWWRGRTQAELGGYDQAAADFRQSMAAHMTDQALVRFTRVMEKQGRPCEAAFAFRSYVDAYPDDELEWALREESRLYIAGSCRLLDGRGTARLDRRVGQAALETDAQVADGAGHFAVDTSSGLSVVSSAFAKRAGLVPRDGLRGRSFTVQAASQFRPAYLAIADVRIGTASAAAVHIAVVDSLPPGLDGILGQSFLSRFLVEAGRGKLTLAGP
jgi:tetratricopeptide (TPR) repeat protein